MRTSSFLTAPAVAVLLTGVLAPAGVAGVTDSPHESKLQPGQLVVCSRGAHSDVLIDTLTTPSDTPNAGTRVVSIDPDSCQTVVDVPDGAYPIDGTYRIRLEGFKERPPACESHVEFSACNLPFHHVEIRHADKPGVTDIDEPDVTVTVSALDGVRVDFVHRPDYGPNLADHAAAG